MKATQANLLVFLLASSFFLLSSVEAKEARRPLKRSGRKLKLNFTGKIDKRTEIFKQGECGKGWEPTKRGHHPKRRASAKRMAGGSVVKVGQYPSYVYSWLLGCGGALISDQWIITSGQCIYNLEKKVYYEQLLGAASFILATDELPEFPGDPTEYYAEGWCSPLEFAKPGLDDSRNYGFIKLNKKIQTSDNFMAFPVCWPEKEIRKMNKDDKLEVVGFGSTSQKTNGIPSNRLQRLELVYDEFKDPSATKKLIYLQHNSTNLDVAPTLCTHDLGSPIYGQEGGTQVLKGLAINFGRYCNESVPVESIEIQSALSEIKHFLGDCICILEPDTAGCK